MVPIDDNQCQTRGNYFSTITAYIVSVSFWRMQRRIVHPTSVEFIHALRSMEPQDIANAFKEFQLPSMLATQSQGDNLLGLALKSFGPTNTAKVMGTNVEDEGLSALLG